MSRCINQFRTFAAMWTEKKIRSQKSSLKILWKKTYAAGKLASAKTISSPWPILAKVWSKSGDKMTGIPFKRPIFFNAENSCFSAGVFIFGFATQWLFTYSRNLPIRSSDFTTEAKIQYEYSIHSIKDNLSNFVNFFQFYCFSFLLLSFHFIHFWSNSVRRFLRFFRAKDFQSYCWLLCGFWHNFIQWFMHFLICKSYVQSHHKSISADPEKVSSSF